MFIFAPKLGMLTLMSMEVYFVLEPEPECQAKNKISFIFLYFLDRCNLQMGMLVFQPDTYLPTNVTMHQGQGETYGFPGWINCRKRKIVFS